MIEIQNLSKNYDNNRVLDGIEIQINDGEMFGIIGKSGAGKSTLLRCINGLEPFDEGHLLVDGLDVKNLNYREMRNFRKNFGMVFQNFSLLERLNVLENVSLPMKFWKYPKKEKEKIALSLIEKVGLEDKKLSYPRELSGGQKQRVAIARALTMNPKFLLCDEATSALDPNTSKAILELLSQINKELGITIIIVTHEMSVIKSCCDRMTIIENGKTVMHGDVEEIFLEQSEPLTRLLGEPDISYPTTGINYKIILSEKNTDSPIITNIGKQLGKDIIVLGGETERFKHHSLGTIYINVTNEDDKVIREYFDSYNIFYKKINIDKVC